jgi:hypothetical protein
MRVKSAFRSTELSDKSPAYWMPLEMEMPRRLDREPKLGAMEGEQFFAWIIQREQSIGPLKRHPRGIQDVVELKIIPCISFELSRDEPAIEYRAQDRASSVASCHVPGIHRLQTGRNALTERLIRLNSRRPRAFRSEIFQESSLLLFNQDEAWRSASWAAASSRTSIALR